MYFKTANQLRDYDATIQAQEQQNDQDLGHAPDTPLHHKIVYNIRQHHHSIVRLPVKQS